MLSEMLSTICWQMAFLYYQIAKIYFEINLGIKPSCFTVLFYYLMCHFSCYFDRTNPHEIMWTTCVCALKVVIYV
jgi:hypothetical protein